MNNNHTIKKLIVGRTFQEIYLEGDFLHDYEFKWEHGF